MEVVAFTKIPREKIGVIENCKILRERQKDAIKNYLEDEIFKMMGNLLFVYEKKLTLDTEQWMVNRSSLNFLGIKIH